MVSREEQETHAWLNNADEYAFVSTDIPKDMRYWLAQADDPRVTIMFQDTTHVAAQIEKSALSIRLKRVRVMTDEQKAAAAERLANARQRRHN